MSTTLTIDPPLPCATLRPTEHTLWQRCGQPATVAQAERLGDGSYMILPICRECTTAMARNYGVGPGQAGEGTPS